MKSVIAITTFLTLFLLSSCSRAQPNWVLIFEENNGNKFYIDKSVIKKSGNIISYAMLSNTPIGFGLPGYGWVHSGISLDELDCEKKIVRSVHIELYERLHGKGDLLYLRDDPNVWMPVNPALSSGKTAEYVCK